jgi:predicted phage tail protein
MSIFGAGGGGGKGKSGVGGRKAKEAKDNLDSTAYAKIIELLSEGEIEGFATPSRLGLTQGTTAYMNASMKDVFFNKTPLLRTGASNTDPQEADFNFSNVDIATRFGTQSQSYVPGFDAVEDEISVGSDVVEGIPVTRTITDSNVNAVRLTINVPLLQTVMDTGDIEGAEINLQIAVQYNGGGYTTVIDDTIKGRTSDLYQRDYIVNLTGAFPVDVRVIRITPDSDSVKLSNAFSWFSYTEIIYQKLRYPNTAYTAIRIDAEQFNSIPSRTYKIRGIKVKIPSNATVDIDTGSLTYSGVWNGTFSAAAWTTDPAWILWDLLTSTRYGLGDHIQTSVLDKWAFFRASQYCNELVPTGLNDPVLEPRFSCNVNIQTAEEAYKVINDMCSIFRAMPFWSIGSLTVAQDRPSDPVALFNLSNVTEEGFSYEGSSLKTRATVVIVSWLNLELGDIDREVVEDTDGIARYGVIIKEVSAFATTSRSQAHRIGKWLLYTERYESEIVSFTTGLENGIVLRPGSIIEIADPVKAGVRRGGRISSATDTIITVDEGSDLPSAGTLSVVLADGIVETQAFSIVNGNEITVNSPFTSAPQAGAPWLAENNEVQPTQWRVLAVQEQDGIDYSVSAISYNSSKYAFIENGEPLEQRSISILNQPPAAPVSIAFEELQYVLNGRVATKLSVSWSSVRGVNEYRVRWRGEFNNWTEVKTYGPIYEIEDVIAGLYNVEIYSISATQILSSSPAIASFTVQGVGAPPADPTGVSLVPINESTAIIQWDLAIDLDVLIGGEVLIRHDPRTPDLAEWSTSNAIVQAAAGNQTQKQVPLLEGTYFVAFRDQSGNRSVNPVAVEAILPTPQPRLLIKTWEEHLLVPPFSGVSTDMYYSDEYNGLVLDYQPSLLGGFATTVYTSLDTVDGGTASTDYSGLDILSGSDASGTGIPIEVKITGSYEYKDTLDLEQVYDVNIRRRIISFPISFGILFDDVPGLFDSQQGDFDGSNLDQVNALTYVRTTEDDPAGSPSWGVWSEYANAIVRARGIQLKTVVTSSSPQMSVTVSELGAIAELQQRIESGSDSGDDTYNIVFASAFYQSPEIAITASNMTTGDYFTITSVTRTGFTVAFKDSSNAAVVRSFSYTATGYGREIV